MNYLAKNTDITKNNTPCAVVFAAGKTLLSSAQIADKITGGVLANLVNSGDVKATAGSSLWVTLPAKTSVPKAEQRAFQKLILIQLGKKTKEGLFAVENLRKGFERIATKTASGDIKEITVYLDDIAVDSSHGDHWVAENLAHHITYNHYRYTTSKKATTPLPALNKVTVACSSAPVVRTLNAALRQGEALATGINFARELGNLPGNICTPTYLSKQAKELATSCSKLTTKILGEKQMEKLGMGSLLSVARGSTEEGQLIIMEYKGKSSTKPHVLVGKGITFDTGGISLKPGASMDEMKFDMCGAASVFGTMKSLVDMEAKVHVVAIVAAAENMPAGNATKPGDVVTSMSGRTIEVLNTDAEGRLVLCDALTYAERYKPKSVVDVATLTGACVIALGNHATGLFSNNQALADALLASGKTTNDRAWQMPLWDEYQKSLDSNFADIANIGGREGGSITAACFLSRFTTAYPWAHLDIAGTAWKSGAAKGATGRPVSLLVHYMLNN